MLLRAVSRRGVLRDRLRTAGFKWRRRSDGRTYVVLGVRDGLVHLWNADARSIIGVKPARLVSDEWEVVA